MDLSHLLNQHAKGVFVNCTDNMGATTTMLSMLGVPNLRPVYLGPMNLKAIWGIGAPDYTTDLWGTGNHGFNYHHIVTDDDAATVAGWLPRAASAKALRSRTRDQAGSVSSRSRRSVCQVSAAGCSLPVAIAGSSGA